MPGWRALICQIAWDELRLQVIISSVNPNSTVNQISTQIDEQTTICINFDAQNVTKKEKNRVFYCLTS